MSKISHIKKASCKQICRRSRELLHRTLPTEEHKKVWINFDTLLMYRSCWGMGILAVHDVYNLSMGTHVHH